MEEKTTLLCQRFIENQIVVKKAFPMESSLIYPVAANPPCDSPFLFLHETGSVVSAPALMGASRALLGVGIGVGNAERVGHGVNQTVAAHGGAADGCHIQ